MACINEGSRITQFYLPPTHLIQMWNKSCLP